ncbi:DUF2334 domain-containing protein [Dactylosporangium sp. NPDC048998]|uniref:DUF2334 domain-containing protein n=1 Tax=Dactylosporangium sp. NPDC048998 TaxID=3363976 RepID=UPI00371E2BEF
MLATTKPVVWLYDNIWQLTARSAGFATKYGYMWKGFDVGSVAEVDYRGTALTRDTRNAAGIMDYAVYDTTKAVSVADAVRADGTKFPWGIRSGNLTYIGEIPFSYITANDRYLAFADLLYDALAPKAAARHRALVRIEDVGPDADPAELRAVTDYLYGKRIPFTVAVYSRYRDPKGVNNNGKAQDYTLQQRPLVVSALKYMQSKGGTLLMHGYTHQHMVGQFFPYPVRDVYGSTVIPENIGNIEPEPFNQHPAVRPADLIANARANLAVRDGVASFFYHPYLGTSYLQQTVEGIQGLGYTFVSAAAMTS